MKKNILIGGAAGQGMKSLSHIIGLALKRHGYYVHTHTVYMSRIRGGHNFFQIHFSDQPVTTHSHKLDTILALNQETVDKHKNRLKSDGFVIGDESLSAQGLLLPSKNQAQAINHLKGNNIILLGGLVKAFNLDKKIFLDVLDQVFKNKALDLNHRALEIGYNLAQVKVQLPNKTDDNHMLINGNQAIALGSIAAGLGVFSAYPMTPSTSVMNYLLDHEKDMNYKIEQAEDEISAIHIAIGASAAGVRAMTASSGGGLSLMVEAIGLTAVSETPLVIVDVMRPGPATGLPTKTGQSDLSFLLTASQDEFPRMIIAVKNPEDAFYQTIRAFDLADKYQIPVFIISDQYLADTDLTVDIFKSSHQNNQYLADEHDIDEIYERYKITPSGVSPRIIPGQYNRPVIADNHEHTETGVISEDPINRTEMHLKRLRKLDTLRKDLIEPDFIGSDKAETVLVGFGSTEGAIKSFVKNHPEYCGLVFGDVYPLPLNQLEALSNKTLINVELNATGQLAKLIRMETGIKFDDSILKFDGLQINAEDIKEALYGKHI